MTESLCRTTQPIITHPHFIEQCRSDYAVRGQSFDGYLFLTPSSNDNDMATGLDLIISTICNATFCEPIYDNPNLDPLKTRSKLVLSALEREYNGKHLKITTYDDYPMSWVEGKENETLVGRGVAFILVEMLRKKINFTYDIVMPTRNIEWGGQNPEDSLIGLVNHSKVDFAAAFVPKIAMYRDMVYFSTDLDEGVWKMMLKRPTESAAGSGLLAPFTNDVWYLILVAVMAYGPCISLLTRLRAKLMPQDEPPVPLSPSFWFVYGAFIKQGTTLSPEANTTRVLFTTWWLFIILLSAFYTANLTAFLTLSKFTLDIESPNDLYKKNYRWVASQGGSVQHVIESRNEDLYYLNKMISNGRAEFLAYSNTTQYLSIVNKGAVLVKEQNAIDRLMYKDYQQKAKEGIAEGDRCTYVVAPNPFLNRIRGFVFPVGSNLTILFDRELQYILQAGLVRYLKSNDLPQAKICPLDLQSKDRQLRNTDLMMTYMIMVAGLAAATVTFIGEVVFRRYIRVKVRGTKPKRKKTKYNKNFTVRHYDDSRPPPYDAIFGRSKKIPEGSQRKIINGREYLVLNTHGETRLIPVRTPSAFLYKLEN